MGEFVRLETSEDAPGVGTIRLDRPKMNALNKQVQEEIRAAAAEASERDDVKAVVVWGGERVFAAGADIKEMAEMSYTDMVQRSGALTSAFSAVARIPKPVVAAVNGYALGGGCELALCADIRIAAEDATLGQPEILLGIIPGAGGTQRLSRLVGPSRAKDIIFTGRFVPAAEALAIGLVDKVVPADQVYAEALAWAGRFAGAATYALRAAKDAVDRGLEVDLETGLEIERQQFAALFATRDRSIGMESFVENGPGKARFEGR
jgi:enoyl-CoA hydratase/carnithine racemase